MLAEELRENGFEPLILTASRGLLLEAEKKGFKTIRAPYIQRQNWSGWRNILFPLYFFRIKNLGRWYKRLFEKYKPIVVNLQSRDDWLAATVVAKKMNIGVFWTDHMDLRSWVLTNVNVWYKNWIGKWVLRTAEKADRLIMISDYERSFFDKVVSPKGYYNVVTIRNGVKDMLCNYSGIRPKKDSICYLGRVVDYKGIRELIEAFKEVARNNLKTRLCIYGDGEMEKYEKLSTGCDRISFCGRTDGPLKVLAENEIFVLPSHREGLSLSLLDAAMMGKEIIASNVDGNPEVVVDGKTGLLVSAKNVKELEEAMTWMLKHKDEARKMAKNVRRKYEEEFDFKNIFEEKMLPLYNAFKEKK